MKRVLIIEGMMCQNCAKHVRKALEKLDGVSFVRVDPEAGFAETEGSADAEAMRAAVEEAGYRVTEIR